MTNPLIWLSGAEPGLLRETSDRGRYLGIGSAVLITAGIATLSMTFALHTALRISLGGSIACAVLWGLAIMSIDRWLVVSLHRPATSSEPAFAESAGPPLSARQRRLAAARAWAPYWAMILVRLCLAILFGFVISTPIVLQIFSPEINKEITQIQTAAANQFDASQKHSALTKTITVDQQHVSELESTIISGGGPSPDPYQNPQVKALLTERQQAQAQAKTDYRQWQCQLYGIGGCKAGNGVLAKASQRRYLNDEQQISQDNKQIGALVTQLQQSGATSRGKALRTAEQNLGPAKTQLHTYQAEESSLTSGFYKQNANKAGLLLRLKALGDATSGNGTLRLARLLLLLLFTTIECLPVLVKTLQNFGPESNYEKLVAMRDAKNLNTARERFVREQAAEVIGMDDIIEQANRLSEAREQQFEDIRQQILDAEHELARRTVAAWQAREEEFIARGGWRDAVRSRRTRAGEQQRESGFRGAPGPEPSWQETV